MANYFWLDGSNNRYYLGRPFTYNSIQYTASGATAATFASLSFTQVNVAAKPDQRFFTSVGPNDSGQWSTTDKPVAQLKDTFVEQQRRLFNNNVEGGGTLKELIYAFKDSGTLPATYTSFLTNAKTYHDANVVKINAVASATAMETLINAQKWVLVDPLDPADGFQLNSTTHLEPQPLTPHAIEEIYGTITIVRNGADLTSAKFGGTYYDQVDGVFAYELTAVSDNTPGTTMNYSMPNGFSGTSIFPATGTSNLNIKYQGTTVGTLAVLAQAGAQTFTFGNQY